MDGQQKPHHITTELLEKLVSEAKTIGTNRSNKREGVLSLFTSPNLSVQGYHFTHEGKMAKSAKLITRAKTPEGIRSEWEFLRDEAYWMQPHEQYEVCMDLVAEMRYAAYIRAEKKDLPFKEAMEELIPLMNEIKQFGEALTNVDWSSHYTLIEDYIAMDTLREHYTAVDIYLNDDYA